MMWADPDSFCRCWTGVALCVEASTFRPPTNQGTIRRRRLCFAVCPCCSISLSPAVKQFRRAFLQVHQLLMNQSKNSEVGGGAGVSEGDDTSTNSEAQPQVDSVLSAVATPEYGSEKVVLPYMVMRYLREPAEGTSFLPGDATVNLREQMASIPSSLQEPGGAATVVSWGRPDSGNSEDMRISSAIRALRAQQETLIADLEEVKSMLFAAFGDGTATNTQSMQVASNSATPKSRVKESANAISKARSRVPKSHLKSSSFAALRSKATPKSPPPLLEASSDLPKCGHSEHAPSSRQTRKQPMSRAGHQDGDRSHKKRKKSDKKSKASENAEAEVKKILMREKKP